MKLVIAIVRDDYAEVLANALTERGFRHTKLASTGGFLRKGNTTLLVGVEDGETDDVIAVKNEVCRPRQEYIPAQSVYTSHSISPGISSPGLPIEAKAGGATIFVVNVERFERY